MSEALWQKSALEIAAGIREKRFSCSEIMISTVERIRALNPKLNAIVADLTEQALAAAATADHALPALAEPGPLFGVPVTIKVNVDQEGQATTNGLPALANFIAPSDAPIVCNLRRAGAIIVGRTNTPEVSMRATTVNPLHGRTLNPWNPDASPGGSSGGAGVAAAARFGPIHHGNDIGGSLRYPALINKAHLTLANAAGLKQIRETEMIGDAGVEDLTVDINTTTSHKVPLFKLKAWLESSDRDPREAALKSKLR